MSDYATIPPISTPLIDPDGAGSLTQKEWYRFWGSLGLGVNSLSDTIQFGAMEDMPDPAGVPRGSLYFVNDPGYVIYQNLDDGWHYVAGTMWGTLTPDERPTGLGPNDAGFDFRGTDQAREFIWSGSAWIEATAVRYGTHADRLALTVANIADAMVWMETDRNNVIYQLQAGVWKYAAGTMTGTISPDQRPSGLGTNDKGFRFDTSDAPLTTYVWDGAVWTNRTGTSFTYYGWTNGPAGAVTLTTAPTPLPGLTLTLPRAGVYMIHLTVDCSIVGADGVILCQITAGGGATTALSTFAGASGTRGTVGAELRYVASGAGIAIAVNASKTSGTGTSGVFTANSALSAFYVSP